MSASEYLLLARKEIITREDNPPRIVAILDEGALYRSVGGPEVMREQLLALIEVIALPNVSVFIVPSHVGAYAGLDGSVALATAHGHTVGVREAPGQVTLWRTLPVSTFSNGSGRPSGSTLCHKI
jgi:hypothetical protein